MNNGQRPKSRFHKTQGGERAVGLGRHNGGGKEIICLASHLSHSFFGPFYSASSASDPDLAQPPLFLFSSSPPPPNLGRLQVFIFAHTRHPVRPRARFSPRILQAQRGLWQKGPFPPRRKQGSMVVGHPRRSGGGQLLLPWTRVHEYPLLISGQRVCKALDAK